MTDVNLSNQKEQTQHVTKVTICLDPDHSKCNGAYFDVTRKYTIKCLCNCHIKRILSPGEALTNVFV
jgi:hypothetical protein